MADRYWVTGGTGNWSSTTNWSLTDGGASGASVPGVADRVLFLNPGSGSGTAVLDVNASIESFFNSAWTGTLAFGTNTITLNGNGNIFGSSSTPNVTGTPLIIVNYSGTNATSISPGTGITAANSISFRFTAGTYDLTINTGSVRNLDFTDGTNPTGYAGALQDTAITIFGDLKLSTGMTVSSGIRDITFAATSGTKTINTAGVTIDRPLTFNGVGGTFQLASALTSGSTRTLTLTNGTLDLNGYTLTVGLFNSSNGNTRTLAFGTGNIVLIRLLSGSSFINCATATNLTVTGAGGFVRDQVATGTISFGSTSGGSSANAPNVTVNGGSNNLTITDGSWFKNVNFTGSTCTVSGAVNVSGSLTLASGGTYTGVIPTFVATGTVTNSGKTLGSATVSGSGITVTLADNMTLGSADTFTLTQGTFDLSNQTLTTGLFTTDAANATTLAFGTGNITLSGTGTIFTGSTTCTVTGTPQVICTNSSATSRTITPGAVTEANSISFRFTAGTGTITNTAGSALRDLDFTDGVNPTGYAGAFSALGIILYGSLKASTNMTASSGTGTLTFAATSGTKTIDTAGVTFDRPFTFNGVGGTWQLQAALTSGSTRTATLTNGTLDLAGYTATFGSVSSSNSNIRTFAFGSTGKFVLLNNTATLFTTSTATNLTVTGTNPLIQATYSGSTGTRTIIMGAAGEANSISVDVTAGSDTVSLQTTGGAYKNVNFTGFTGTYSQSGTIIVYGNWHWGGVTANTSTTTIQFSSTSGTKTITSNGKSFTSALTFLLGTWQLQDALTTAATATTTLTAGTLDLNNQILTTGLFSSTNSNTRTLAFGTGKIVLTATTGTVLSMSTATNFTYTGTSRIEVTASGAGRTITPIATNAIESNALNIYVTTGSDTVTVSGAARFLNFDLTGFAGTLTYASSSRYFGDLVFSSGMTLGAISGGFTFAKTSGTQTITTAGKTIDTPVTIDGVGGTVSLQDALTLGSTRTLTMTNGTLKLKAGTTNTVGDFATSGTNQKFLQSTTAGSQATISDPSGTVSVSYLTIQDSNATGGAIWQSFTSNQNIDGGNNTGWIFTSSAGNMFLLFN